MHLDMHSTYVLKWSHTVSNTSSDSVLHVFKRSTVVWKCYNIFFHIHALCNLKRFWTYPDLNIFQIPRLYSSPRYPIALMKSNYSTKRNFVRWTLLIFWFAHSSQIFQRHLRLTRSLLSIIEQRVLLMPHQSSLLYEIDSASSTCRRSNIKLLIIWSYTFLGFEWIALMKLEEICNRKKPIYISSKEILTVCRQINIEGSFF